MYFCWWLKPENHVVFTALDFSRQPWEVEASTFNCSFKEKVEKKYWKGYFSREVGGTIPQISVAEPFDFGAAPAPQRCHK